MTNHSTNKASHKTICCFKEYKTPTPSGFKTTV